MEEGLRVRAKNVCLIAILLTHSSLPAEIRRDVHFLPPPLLLCKSGGLCGEFMVVVLEKSVK